MSLEIQNNVATLTMQQRHDTEAKWENSNYIPLKGEIIVYDVDGTNLYERFKIGDGENKVTDLPFLTSSYATTPELFGAVGDGITDDTDAIQKCFQSEFPCIIATNTYKITDTIAINTSKRVIGGGTFYTTPHEPSDSNLEFFYMFYGESETAIPYFEVDNITFKTERSAEKLGKEIIGTEQNNAKYSNVLFLSLRNFSNVRIKNTQFINAEACMQINYSDDVLIDNFHSIDVSQTFYGARNKKITISNGYSKLYELSYTSAHHLYFGAGNDDVFVLNTDLISSNGYGQYPIHVYASQEQIENSYATKRCFVRNCYIEHGQHVTAAAVVSELFEMDSCICKHIQSVNDGIKKTGMFMSYLNYTNPVYKIKNTTFKNCDKYSIQSNINERYGTLKFINCEFDGGVQSYGNILSSTEFNNCKMKHLDVQEVTNKTDSNSFSIDLTSCYINETDDLAIKVHGNVSGTLPSLKLEHCYLHSNSQEGVLRVAHNAADITLIGCYGDNDNSEYFDKINNDISPSIKIYDCSFPTLKLKNLKNVTTKHNIWLDTSDTDTRVYESENVLISELKSTDVKFNVGDALYTKGSTLPNIFIYKVNSTTYTTFEGSSEEIVNELKQNHTCNIGYYTIAVVGSGQASSSSDIDVSNLVEKQEYTTYDFVYGVTSTESSATIKLSTSPEKNALSMYGNNGCLTTGTPINNTDCANKKYVDDILGDLVKTLNALNDYMNEYTGSTN